MYHLLTYPLPAAHLFLLPEALARSLTCGWLPSQYSISANIPFGEKHFRKECLIMVIVVKITIAIIIKFLLCTQLYAKAFISFNT